MRISCTSVFSQAVHVKASSLFTRESSAKIGWFLPPCPSAAHFENRPPDATFFPGPSGGPFSLGTVYTLFRKLLLQCGIPHAGRSKGPRIHDARHLFAVRVLRRWYQDGADLDAKLPLLATYLGHVNLSGTQRYLHLTAELFPEITARADAAFGDVIPGRVEP
jgi:integrase